MSEAAREIAKQLLRAHEGLRLHLYDDATGRPMTMKGATFIGYPTIGYGHNLAARPITKPIAEAMLEQDLDATIDELRASLFTAGWFDALDPIRQAVVIDMAFNLGVRGIGEFARMRQALAAKHYAMASKEMLRSRWADQVGARARELALIMQTGRIETP